jgi:hypothetical protein
MIEALKGRDSTTGECIDRGTNIGADAHIDF